MPDQASTPDRYTFKGLDIPPAPVSAIGKILAAVIGIGIPMAVIGVDYVYFSSNPLTLIACLTAIMGGGLYLLTYQEHE